MIYTIIKKFIFLLMLKLREKHFYMDKIKTSLDVKKAMQFCNQPLLSRMSFSHWKKSHGEMNRKKQQEKSILQLCV